MESRNNKRRRLVRRTTIVEEVYNLENECSLSSINEKENVEIAELWDELSLVSQDSFILRDVNRDNSNDSYVYESDSDSDFDSESESESDSDLDTPISEIFQEQGELDEDKIPSSRKRKRGYTPIYILGFLHQIISDFGKESTLREHLQTLVEEEKFDVKFVVGELSHTSHFKDACDRCIRERTLSCELTLQENRYFIGRDCVRYVELIQQIFSELQMGYNPDPAYYYLFLDEIREEINKRYSYE